MAYKIDEKRRRILPSIISKPDKENYCIDPSHFKRITNITQKAIVQRDAVITLLERYILRNIESLKSSLAPVTFSSRGIAKQSAVNSIIKLKKISLAFNRALSAL